MNPIVGTPVCTINNGQLYIDGTFVMPNNYSLSPAVLNFDGNTITVATNILNDNSNPSVSFSLTADISVYPNTAPIVLKIFDLTEPNTPPQNQNIGAAINLPPKNIIAGGGAPAQGIEKILFRIDFETLNILERMLANFSNSYQNTFKAEVPRGYTEFVKHIENAQKSLKSVLEETEIKR